MKMKMRAAGIGLLAACAFGQNAKPAIAQTSYQTLDFGTDATFLTGIRDGNIVGNYVIPGGTATGGLLYNPGSQTWSPFPVATPSGTNFPGSIASSPYGPNFGSEAGIRPGDRRGGALDPFLGRCGRPRLPGVAQSLGRRRRRRLGIELLGLATRDRRRRRWRAARDLRPRPLERPLYVGCLRLGAVWRRYHPLGRGLRPGRDRQRQFRRLGVYGAHRGRLYRRHTARRGDPVCRVRAVMDQAAEF